jgi:hypothetical protein
MYLSERVTCLKYMLLSSDLDTPALRDDNVTLCISPYYRSFSILNFFFMFVGRPSNRSPHP